METGGWYPGRLRCLMDALYPQRFLFPLESGITPEILFLSPEDLELSALRPPQLPSPSKRLHGLD